MATQENKLSLFRKVLVCADFSPGSDHAFEYGVKLCQSLPGCCLILLHVVPESDAQFWKTYIYEVDDVDQKAQHDIDERLERYKRRVPNDLEFHVEIRVGKTHQQILEYTKETGVDLIVIGRGGDHGISKALLGDVADKVCRHAQCAVMVMPVPRK